MPDPRSRLEKLVADAVPRRRRRRRVARKSAAPVALSELIERIEPRCARDAAAREPLAHHQWEKLVGPRIADRSDPVSLDPNGTLLVRVPDSVWAQELSLLSSSILARLGSAGLRVRALRFVVGATKAPRRGPMRFERRHAAAPALLPRALQAEIDRIDDADLRAAIREAAQASLGQAQARAHRARTGEGEPGRSRAARAARRAPERRGG
jgi:hypothetical protein